MKTGRPAPAASVAAALARWRAGFVVLFVVELVLKLLIASRLSPFVDEAFYWQESRHPAWGYSDLPPLTAWLIRLGEGVAGHGLLGMRWPFLLLGSVLPWLVVGFARQLQRDDAVEARARHDTAAWQAGVLCLLLPLAGSLGVLALPDVPLTVAIMLALHALMRAVDTDRLWAWLLLGVALAVAWMTHYRAAMAMLVGLLFCVLTPDGRRLWRRGGLWLAMGVATPGLVPLLVSNWQQRGAGLAFQLVERNPWSFHADALVQPLEQALSCTPILYGMLLWAAWRSWRRRHDPGAWSLVAVAAAGFIVLYFVFGLFADDLRFRAHWPLPGYLPLLAVLPTLCRRLPYGRIMLAVSGLFAGVGLAFGLLYLGLAASPQGAAMLAGTKAFPSHFTGWRESGVMAGQLLERKPALLVADNFMLAAELDFQLDGRYPVYVLDSPLNTKHGRAAQLARWRRDEAALRADHAGEPMLLGVDETVLRERERWDWFASLCSRVGRPREAGRLDLLGGARRLAFYRGQVMSTPATGSAGDPRLCLPWRRAHEAMYGRNAD